MEKYVIAKIILTLLLVAFFNAQSVSAWDTHAEMTGLTNFGLDKNGNIAKYRQTVVEQSPQPDDDKSADHSLASKARAIDACKAAFRDYDQKKYQDSAVQLGHCFHYLQDTGDPTKHIDDLIHVLKGKAERKEYGRSVARSLLLKDSKTPIAAEAEWKSYYPNVHFYFDNLTRVEDILEKVYVLHKGTVDILDRVYKNTPDENERALLIKRAIIRCIANNAGAQNQILEILTGKR